MSGPIRNYHDLEVWKKARILVKIIYKLTSLFPREELYGLTSQLRRAAVSIPSNIAEGHSRSGTKDYIQFVSMAIGSLAEVETQVLLALDLGFCHADDIADIIEQICVLQRMLHALRNSLKSKLKP